MQFNHGISTNPNDLCLILFPPSSYVDAWKSRWVNSEHKSDYGQFKLTSGNFYGDAEKDKGRTLNASL